MLRTNIHTPVRKIRLSIEEINLRIVNESFELVSKEYFNAHKKLEWKCKVCNNLFYSSWLNISFGWGCPICKGKKASVRIKSMRKERGDGIYLVDAVKILNKKGFLLDEILPEYIGNLSKKIKLICLSCDSVYYGRIKDIKRKSGYGCWDCARPRGELHSNWKNAKKDYPKEWNNYLRENIRNRDGRKCQFPRCNYTDIGNTIRLHVHHINGIKQNCSRYNLISLCNNHHMYVESHNPKNWEDYFYSITGDYEMKENKK